MCFLVEHLNVGDTKDCFVLFGKFGLVDHLRHPGDDARGVEVVVERPALAKELREEEEIEAFCSLGRIFEVEIAAVTDGDGGFNHHYGVGVDGENEIYDILDVVGVKVVLYGVVVSGGGDHDEVGIAVGSCAIEGGGEVEILLGKVFLYILILDWGFALIDQLHLFGDDIYSHDMVMLRQKSGDGEADISCAGYCDVIFFHWF